MYNIGTGIIYIDCTNTVFTGLNTGIQRAVRNIIQRIPHTTQLKGTKLVPVIAVMGNFYIFNADISKKFFWTKLLTSVVTTSRNLLNKVFMDKYSEGDWPVDVININPNANDIHGKVVCFARKFLPALFKFVYKADGIIIGKKIEFNKDDVLFLSDAFWKVSLIKSITNISHTDINLIVLIYDLFPVTHPELVDSVHRANFVKCLTALLDYVKGVISISKSSLLDIEKYLADKKKGVLFDYFYLGADFSATGRISGPVRPELVKLFATGSVYLAVGTIEPRKNYNYLFDSFQKIWEQANDIKLCVVGRVGWLCDDVLQRLKTSSENGNRLFHFSDLNDDELEYCYVKSKAIVFPSKVEGFGLPLVEAMHYGKPVFASDIPVFREIGKEYPIYFDIGNQLSLADAISCYEADTAKRELVPEKWISWDESIDSLMSKLFFMTEKITQ